jgi:hypothetical protein
MTERTEQLQQELAQLRDQLEWTASPRQRQQLEEELYEREHSLRSLESANTAPPNRVLP